MEMKVIEKLEYEKTFFSLEKKQNVIIDNLTIEFKNDGKRLVLYNQKQVDVDDDKIDELVDKVIEITNSQGTINEYIDDCGATLKISYDDESIEEYNRGFGNEQIDIGILFDDFIYDNFGND